MLLHMLRKNGYPDRLHPVSPSCREIEGLACYPSLAELARRTCGLRIARPNAEGFYNAPVRSRPIEMNKNGRWLFGR